MRQIYNEQKIYKATNWVAYELQFFHWHIIPHAKKNKIKLKFTSLYFTAHVWVLCLSVLLNILSQAIIFLFSLEMNIFCRKSAAASPWIIGLLCSTLITVIYSVSCMHNAIIIIFNTRCKINLPFIHVSSATTVTIYESRNHKRKVKSMKLTCDVSLSLLCYTYFSPHRSSCSRRQWWDHLQMMTEDRLSLIHI